MTYYSWNIRRDRHNFLSFWTIFCPFTVTLTIWRIKILKNWKRTPGNIIILHMCTINDNHMMYVSWRYRIWQTEFFVILDAFLPFYPTNNTDNQNFEKMKKTPEDIIALNMCTINDNHIIYGAQEKQHERQFFVKLSHFMPFYSTNNLQNQNFEKNGKKRNAWRYYHFTYVYHNGNHLIYGSWDIELNEQSFW